MSKRQNVLQNSVQKVKIFSREKFKIQIFYSAKGQRSVKVTPFQTPICMVSAKCDEKC